MSIQTIYNYSTASDYTFDTSKINVSGGKASLKLQSLGGLVFPQTFTSDIGFTYDSLKVEFVGGVAQQKTTSITESYTQAFTSDVGFTYDNTKAEFVGGVCRQKSNRPTGTTFGTTYTTDVNGSWGDGVLTGTASGGATVSGGKLNLKGGTQKYVTYNAANNAPNTQTGCIRLKYTPNYSGVPVGNRYLFDWYSNPANDSNSLQIFHNAGTGNLYARLCDNLGNYIFANLLAAWVPVSGTEYEFEFNFNFTTGATRLFVDGVQIGTTITATGTRTAPTYLRIGVAHDLSNSDGEFNDIIIFSTVQHVGNYTPGYVVNESDYLETVVVAPMQTYTYNPVSLSAPTIIGTNIPKYVINGYYYNGAAWVASSDTYATAMTYAQWITNIVTFPSAQLSTGVIIKTIFQGTNTLSSIDNILFTINENYYTETSIVCPEMVYTGAGTLQSITAFAAIDTNTPRYTFQAGRSGNYLYWSGSAWVVSDGSYTQSNTATVFNAHAAAINILGQIYGQFKVHFGQSVSTKQSVASSQTTVTGETYDTNSPSVVANAGIQCDGIYDITSTTAGAGSVNYILEKDSIKYYYNSGWVVSNGTYAQSNTLSVLQTNLVTFTTSSILLKIYALLKSDGNQTSEIDLMNVFTNYAPTPVTVTKRTCFINTKDFIGDSASGCPIKIKLNNKAIKYNNETLIINEVIDTTTSAGYYDLDLVETTSMEASSYYIITINKRTFLKTVPIGTPINILNLPDYVGA